MYVCMHAYMHACMNVLLYYACMHVLLYICSIKPKLHWYI